MCPAWQPSKKKSFFWNTVTFQPNGVNSQPNALIFFVIFRRRNFPTKRRKFPTKRRNFFWWFSDAVISQPNAVNSQPNAVFFLGGFQSPLIFDRVQLCTRSNACEIKKNSGKPGWKPCTVLGAPAMFHVLHFKHINSGYFELQPLVSFKFVGPLGPLGTVTSERWAESGVHLPYFMVSRCGWPTSRFSGW